MPGRLDAAPHLIRPNTTSGWASAKWGSRVSISSSTASICPSAAMPLRREMVADCHVSSDGLAVAGGSLDRQQASLRGGLCDWDLMPPAGQACTAQ